MQIRGVTLVTVGLAGALVIGSAGFAISASLSSAQVKVCVKTSSRLVVAPTTAGRCPSGSKLISINKVGPRGAAGLRGTTGARGATGLRGPSGAPAPTPAVPFVSGPDVSVIGDSLTAGSGSPRGYGAFLQDTIDTLPHPGVVHNLGVGGETSSTIAGRAGGRPWLAAVAGQTIPATGPVQVTLSSDTGAPVAPLVNFYGDTGINPVQIAGVTGTLALSSGTYTFTRSAAGNAVPVPRPAPVITESARDRRGDITVLWWGQNDPGTDATDLIPLYRATIESLTPLEKRWLVLGLSSGTAAFRAPMDKQLLDQYGRRFLNIRAYLSSAAALQQAGLTATPADLDAIDDGEVPPSLRYDGLHLNEAGYRLVAAAVWERFTELGWDSVWR